ncbi:hypothetical protein BDR06DRAFT_59419 [Suillus hirtellus]|nr:hypothetical protein BDR06DRAFT_59419 [Suillus hirtellus]
MWVTVRQSCSRVRKRHRESFCIKSVLHVQQMLNYEEAGWIIKMSTSRHRKINDHMTETGRRHSWLPLSSSQPHSQYCTILKQPSK